MTIRIYTAYRDANHLGIDVGRKQLEVDNNYLIFNRDPHISVSGSVLRAFGGQRQGFEGLVITLLFLIILTHLVILSRCSTVDIGRYFQALTE